MNYSIVLIGNYPPDRQESMRRFAEGLAKDLKDEGIDVIVWIPLVLFGKAATSTVSGVGKWLGYIDKWLLFPIVLLFRLFFKGYGRSKFRFHICDHSNSPYINWLPKKRTLITCHDVLAIRGAKGYADAYCPATATGKILQQWILNNLSKAIYLSTVSGFTMQQLLSLLSKTNAQKPVGWNVIYNTFNASFHHLESNEAIAILQHKYSIHQPFLLHIGSGLPRKNRKLLVDMLFELKDRWNGVVCFAGDLIEPNLKKHIESLGLSNRVINVHKPLHNELVALYSLCEAFIFPSFSEGFGWPLIEAQACGAPVIASNLQPMKEVAGGAALHASPTDAAGFAEALLQLKNVDLKEDIVAKGYENCKRFDKAIIIKAYVQLYDMQS